MIDDDHRDGSLLLHQLESQLFFHGIENRDTIGVRRTSGTPSMSQRSAPSSRFFLLFRVRYTEGRGVRVGPAKGRRQSPKHKVSFDEASTVFGETLSATASDPDHAAEEHRYITVGTSRKLRLLMVAHTERGGRIRIISARMLTGTERRAYEEIEP
jgi:uncharacterized protein